MEKVIDFVGRSRLITIKSVDEIAQVCRIEVAGADPAFSGEDRLGMRFDALADRRGPRPQGTVDIIG